MGTGTPFACSYTRSINGEMTFELDGDGASGRGTLRMTHTDLSVTGPGCSLQNNPLDVRMNDYFSVGGGPSALAFSVTQTTNTGAQRTDQFTFNGSLSDTTITGTLSWETRDQTPSPSGPMSGSGSFTIPVTLQQR